MHRFRLSINHHIEIECHCEGEARGNPHPQNLTVLNVLPSKSQHFGERIATSGYALLAMTVFFDTLKRCNHAPLLFAIQKPMAAPDRFSITSSTSQKPRRVNS